MIRKGVVEGSMSVERIDRVRSGKSHPALKHAGYSATTLLPGEDAAAFEKLHRYVIAELVPVGAGEKVLIAQIAHLTWRKLNLAIFRIANGCSFAKRHQFINTPEFLPSLLFRVSIIKGLTEELDLIDRLNGQISKCLKQLLMVRGIKSTASSSTAALTHIARPQRAG